MPQPASHSQPHSQFRLLQGPTSPFPHIVDPAGPILRTGSYVPDWLLERRKRAESALITVVAYAGLVEAIVANLSGATWRRYCTHYAANLMTDPQERLGRLLRPCSTRSTRSTTSPTQQSSRPRSTTTWTTPLPGT